MYKIVELNVNKQIGRNIILTKRFVPFTDDKENQKVLEKEIVLYGWMPENFSPINFNIFYDTYEKALGAIEKYKTKIKDIVELGVVKIYDID